MKTDELRAALARVKPGPVKVVLAAKKVVAGIPESGLWPRVTLLFDGKEEVVGLTEYADVKKDEVNRKAFSKLEVAVLRIVGVPSRSMRSLRSNRAVMYALQDAVKKVHYKINSAISKAPTTKHFGGRVENVQRKHRKSRATEAMKEKFRQLLRGTVKVNDMTGRQVGEIWERVKMEKIVEEVHDF